MIQVCIIMDESVFEELTAEINVRTIMNQLSPKHSVMERMAILYCLAKENNLKRIEVPK
jgi:hypothetical protein